MKFDKNTALLLIDVQKGFLDGSYWGPRNNPQMEERISDLLTAFRTHDFPVLHIRHHSLEEKSPLRPNQDGAEFMDIAIPMSHEAVFTKTVNSAFIGTSLESHLRSHGISNLIMAGLTSDQCVSTSARMAANLGFEVTIAEDAVATFDRVGFDGNRYAANLVHAVSLASLRNEFASIQTTRDVLMSLSGRA